MFYTRMYAHIPAYTDVYLNILVYVFATSDSIRLQVLRFAILNKMNLSGPVGRNQNCSHKNIIELQGLVMGQKKAEAGLGSAGRLF